MSEPTDEEPIDEVDACESIETRRRSRPRMPTVSNPRMSMWVVVSTILVGQASILKELGAFGDHQGLYQLAALMSVLWAFWPQISYGLNRALGKLVTYLDNKQGESNV